MDHSVPLTDLSNWSFVLLGGKHKTLIALREFYWRESHSWIHRVFIKIVNAGSYFVSCIIFPIQYRNTDFVYFEVCSCLKSGEEEVRIWFKRHVTEGYRLPGHRNLRYPRSNKLTTQIIFSAANISAGKFWCLVTWPHIRSLLSIFRFSLSETEDGNIFEPPPFFPKMLRH